MTDSDPEGLPAFEAWRRQFRPPPDKDAYLAQHLDIASAVFFAELLAPRFIEVRGCVVLHSRYESVNFETWWEATSGDIASVEAVLNHMHLWDLLEPQGPAEEAALFRLADVIRLSWLLHAQMQFPGKAFTASVADDYGPTVTITSQPLTAHRDG